MTVLTIDGQEYQAVETRCFAYKALRRNRYCNGTSVETDVRMINEARNVMCRITATNTTILSRRITIALRIPGKLMADGIGVSNNKQRPGVVSGDSDECDHSIPAQADHPFRAKLTRAFRGKLTTPNA